MVLNLLVALCGLALVISGCTLVMVFGLRADIDGLLSLSRRIEAGLSEPEAQRHGRRVTIARDHELPDEMEAMMERRAQKPPMN